MVKPETMEIGLPDKMQAYQDGMDLVIVRRWFGATTVILTAFAAVWDGFMVFWYSHTPNNAPSLFFWFPLLHVGAGIYLTYRALAGWLNRTHLRVGQGRLSVRTAPLPFFNNRSIGATTVKQLYSKSQTHSGGEGGSWTSYSLHVVTNDGRNIKLVSDLESSEQAIFLEQEIEKRLGIVNVHVPGQIG